jgi:hypothetical protein
MDVEQTAAFLPQLGLVRSQRGMESTRHRQRETVRLVQRANKERKGTLCRLFHLWIKCSATRSQTLNGTCQRQGDTVESTSFNFKKNIWLLGQDCPHSIGTNSTCVYLDPLGCYCVVLLYNVSWCSRETCPSKQIVFLSLEQLDRRKPTLQKSRDGTGFHWNGSRTIADRGFPTGTPIK